VTKNSGTIRPAVGGEGDSTCCEFHKAGDQIRAQNRGSNIVGYNIITFAGRHSWYRSSMQSCLFCQIASRALGSHPVYADEHTFAFLDKAPLQFGHVLVIPKQHIITLSDLPTEGLGRYFEVVQRMCGAVERAMDAEGTFVAANNKVSQSVPHLHFHVVPRRKGDGLKGFFWPRKKYASEEEMGVVAERIRAALK
jgi:histidine triad (HIT) family protein